MNEEVRLAFLYNFALYMQSLSSELPALKEVIQESMLMSPESTLEICDAIDAFLLSANNVAKRERQVLKLDRELKEEK